MSNLHTSIDVHPTTGTPIAVRRSKYGPGTLLIGEPKERIAIHLWGDSAQRLLRILQEAGVDKWEVKAL